MKGAVGFIYIQENTQMRHYSLWQWALLKQHSVYFFGCWFEKVT